MDKEQPWWNDGDKVGGMVATILGLTLVIGVAILFLAGFMRLGLWIIGVDL